MRICLTTQLYFTSNRRGPNFSYAVQSLSRPRAFLAMLLIEQPTELLVHVFGHLDIFDLLHLSHVTPRFSVISHCAYLRQSKEEFWVIVNEYKQRSISTTFLSFNTSYQPTHISFTEIPQMLPAGYSLLKGSARYYHDFYAVRVSWKIGRTASAAELRFYPSGHPALRLASVPPILSGWLQP